MKLHSFLTVALTTVSSVEACMEFSGTFPFSNTLPFEASIIDNGVTTCWLSTTYSEHSSLQNQLTPDPSSSRISKRSNGHHISLTDRPALDTKSESTFVSPFTVQGPKDINEKVVDLTLVPPPRNGLPKTSKFEEPEWEDIPVWQPWQFECISGYKARANVGLRSFVYVAHGQEFFFVPKVSEDIWGDKWVYKLKLWCGEKDKQGNVVERPRPKGSEKKVEEAKKEQVKSGGVQDKTAVSSEKKEGEKNQLALSEGKSKTGTDEKASGDGSKNGL